MENVGTVFMRMSATKMSKNARFFHDCWDCKGYNRIKNKCVAEDGHPDGSDYSCENFVDRMEIEK
jgi:hypothetical protein